MKEALVFAAKTYGEFRQRLSESGCYKCPELCQSRTNIVPDRGNPQAGIMIVGEAPGEQEDLRGQAFVGRSGRLLDRIMAFVGLDTNRDALIVNVVKCRPPKNRPPTDAEAANCFQYLKWQMEHVRPKVVVLLGATAAKHLMPDQRGRPMKDSVGKFFDLVAHPGVKFMLMYHPAYLLRDPRRIPIAQEHARALKAFLESNYSIV